MPPDPKQNPPAPPTAPADPSPPALESRVSGLEAEQQRQGGMLEQILAKLGGKPPASAQEPGQGPVPAGKSVAELVREGITALEAERAAAAETDANKTAREDHARRLAALEERSPAETAATPVGAFRARAQRVMFGIDQPDR